MTNYYPPGPMCVASYEEEDGPTLVNNLIPRPTLKKIKIQIRWKKANLQKTKETG